LSYGTINREKPEGRQAESNR